tara:strand:- start:2989 stop:3156 length:168 start_codon:yes stop_codon:yes gene_type:complete
MKLIPESAEIDIKSVRGLVAERNRFWRALNEIEQVIVGDTSEQSLRISSIINEVL